MRATENRGPYLTDGVLDLLVEMGLRADATVWLASGRPLKVFRTAGGTSLILALCISEPLDDGDPFFRWRILWRGPVASQRLEGHWTTLWELHDKGDQIDLDTYYKHARVGAVFRLGVIAGPRSATFYFAPEDQR